MACLDTIGAHHRPRFNSDVPDHARAVKPKAPFASLSPPYLSLAPSRNAPFAAPRVGAGAIGNILVGNGDSTAWLGERQGNKVSGARL
jgi:hypothetical protein